MARMCKITRVWIGCFLATLFCAFPAVSQEDAAIPPAPSVQPLKDYNDIGLYHVSWSGVPVGLLLMDAHETASTYTINVRTEAIGLLKPVTRHKSTMNTRGSKQNGRYIPQHFETVFKLRGDTREISLDFDTSGKLVAETNEPPEPEWKRPKVPAELKGELIDPISLFYVHRPLIHAALLDPAKKNFTIRYYDGRRLTDLHYTVIGLKNTDINKVQTPIYYVVVTREAIAGYKDKELKEMKGKDLKLHLYLSTDGRLMPLKFVVDAAMGAYYAEYRQSCDTLEACNKLMK